MRDFAINIEAEFAKVQSGPRSGGRPATGRAPQTESDHLVKTLLTPPEMSEVTSSKAPAMPRPPGAAR
jgi:hypothetical protein